MAKYHYYRVFRRDRILRRHMPDTALCTLHTLGTYLAKYGTVYVKPDVGGRGEGVTKVWKDNGRYAYIVEKGRLHTCATVAELYDQLGLARKKRHVVQRGLLLAAYGGNRFDIRLMMIRSPKRSWRYSGMLAKTAGQSSVVTNIARGKGQVVPIEQALRASCGGRSKAVQRALIALAYRCNRSFDRIRYEWQIGYDFAVDVNGKVWLIEANPGNPAHSLFRKLRDKTLYRGIKRACTAYRRANHR